MRQCDREFPALSQGNWNWMRMNKIQRGESDHHCCYWSYEDVVVVVELVKLEHELLE